MSGPRIGLLGGTFDPIHAGHVSAAQLVRDRLGLDAVWLMPTHVPPHRSQQPQVSPFHRYGMTALACAGRPWLSASPLELEHPGPSYTADTLARLHARGVSASHIFFITGADAFAEIATWKRYPDVLDMAVFTVVGRTTLSLDGLTARLPSLAARWMHVSGEPDRVAIRRRAGDDGPQPIVLIEGSLPDVSATEVRGRLRRGLPIDGLVPDLVAEYISRQRLYGDDRDIVVSL